MARALRRILAGPEQPRILDLGQHCTQTAVYLADRGARVCVADFQPPPLTPVAQAREAPSPAKAPIAMAHPDGAFDLVLAWEHFDFIPPDRLSDFTGEVRRVLAPGGFLLLYARDSSQQEDGRLDRPASYRLTADDRMVRAAAAESRPSLPRWSHPNRAIERALSPLAIQGIHLQPDRMREVLAHKPAQGA
jgi:SAM-dependent methyltransferase